MLSLLTKKTSATVSQLQRKLQFSPINLPLALFLQFTADSKRRRNCPTQNELNDVFVDFLSHFALFGHFSLVYSLVCLFLFPFFVGFIVFHVACF